MLEYNHNNAIEATAGLYSMTTSQKTKANRFASKLLNLAKISGWCLAVSTGELECTQGVYDIYHYDKNSTITTERLIQTCLQEDREIWTDLHARIKRFNDSPSNLQQDLNKHINNGDRRKILITEDNTFDVEYRIVVPDGSGSEQIRWIHCHGEIEYENTESNVIAKGDSPTDADLFRYTQHKRVRAVIAAIQDISKFKLQSLFDLPSATANTKSEHEFRLLVESIPQKVFTTDVHGNADYFNSKWLAYCGTSLTETLNRGWTVSVHPEDLPELLKQWEACVSAKQNFEKKFRLRCAIDGQYRWHLTRAVVVRSNIGQVTSYIGTATDIHDQQLAEDKARAAEVYLKSVISNFPVLVMVTDHTGLCTLCEGKGLEVVGLKQSWFLNKTFYETMAQLGTNQYIDYYRRGLNGERFSAELTFNNHILECHFAPFYPDLEHQMRSGLIVVAKDITIRKEAARLAISEASAREAAMLKSEFLATMSHEMRTPLNGIIGMTELLTDTHLDEEQKRYLDSVQNSSTHLLMLINDILDLSKIDAGKIELENIEFTLGQLIDNQLNMFGVALKNKRISMTVEIDEEINKSSFVGDEGRIGQILTNLVSNAIKFTPAQGQISVKAMRAVKEGGKYTKVTAPEQYPELAEAINAGDEAVKPTDIIFTVQDSGIGISKEVQQRLFQPFTQANNSTRRKYGGTGLGLSICKKLVAVMHGEIGVESAEGSGSTFWFTIPLRSVSQSSPNLPTHEKEDKLNKHCLGVPPNVKVQLTKSFSFTQQAHVNLSTGCPHILVVEDHPVNQALMVSMLRKMGCQVELANDGQEAYDLVTVHKKQYDLIFMDCYMPELDGYTATRMLREYEFTLATKHRSLKPFKHMPIIAVTANALLGDREKCFDAGMSDYLTKPITKKSVANILKKWLPNANVDNNCK